MNIIHRKRTEAVEAEVEAVVEHIDQAAKNAAKRAKLIAAREAQPDTTSLGLPGHGYKEQA